MKRINAGEQWHAWTVLEQVEWSPPKWLCRCECGALRARRPQELTFGRSMSCGCRRRRISDLRQQHQKLYSVWKGMRQRCNTSTSPLYKYYGARGIKVCERWSRFESFLEDMGDRTAEGLSIDRINNDGNYEPSNCRWANQGEQMKNTRKTRFLEAHGKRMHMAAWARYLGINPATLHERLAKWPLEKALS